MRPISSSLTGCDRAKTDRVAAPFHILPRTGDPKEVAAAVKGEIGKLFDRDGARSPFGARQRALALTYMHGMTPRPEHVAVKFNLIPGVGEYFVFRP